MSGQIRQETAWELMACLEETRNAAAAIMRAVHASGHVTEVFDELEPGYDGFGVRAQRAIQHARADLAREDAEHDVTYAELKEDERLERKAEGKPRPL